MTISITNIAIAATAYPNTLLGVLSANEPANFTMIAGSEYWAVSQRGFVTSVWVYPITAGTYPLTVLATAQDGPYVEEWTFQIGVVGIVPFLFTGGEVPPRIPPGPPG